MPTPIVPVLQRASQGQATFDELATALAAHDTLWAIMTPQAMAQVQTAAQTPGARAGTVTVDGVTTADGRFAARLFTDDDLAAAFARGRGLAEADGGVPIMTVPPVGGLLDCLVNGWAGLILDDGTDHTMNLERPSVARLYALLTLEDVARRPQLHLVFHRGQLFLQPGAQGQDAFVYETAEDAAAGVRVLGEKAAEITTALRDTGGLLRELLAMGVKQLVVNPGMPTQRGYAQAELERMIALGGVADAEAGGLSGPVIRLRLHPISEVIPPRGRPDVDGRGAFQALRASVASGARPSWQLLESLAYEHDVHVAVHPVADEGLVWPQIIGGEDDPTGLVFTSAELAAFMLSTNAPEARRFEHMAGIEALRWLWSAPRQPRRIIIDLARDVKNPEIIQAVYVLGVFFPLALDVSDLNAVPRVGLGKVGALPGARGLKPEVARALVQGARTLMSLGGPDGAPPAPVEHAGGLYLAVFSDADQFFAFTSRSKVAGKQTPVRSASGSPFADWLSMTVDIDGVLVDPAGPAPLVLSHADLLGLALWAEGRQPRGADLVATLTVLRAGGKLSSRLAGRIAAEWPALFVVRRPGDGRSLLCPRGRTGGAIFTTRQAAQQFMDEGGCEQPAELVGFVPRWGDSPFETMLETYREAWMDPDPSGGGLHLDTEALLGALEVLDERLQPRVPWFIA